MKQLLTVKQAARVAVSPSLIYELCARGVLPHVRLGRPGKRGTIRIDCDELEGFLAACRVEGGPIQADDPPLKYIK
jgi:excisionase family DNA binding protein